MVNKLIISNILYRPIRTAISALAVAIVGAHPLYPQSGGAIVAEKRV